MKLKAFFVSLFASMHRSLFVYMYRTGMVACDTDPTMPEAVQKSLEKISDRVKEIGTKALTRVSEIEIEFGGVRQQLKDLQQHVVQMKGLGGGQSQIAGKKLGEVAEAIVEGIKGATSTKAAFEFGVKSLSSTAVGAMGDQQMAVTPKDLGVLDVYHGLLVRLVDLMPSFPVTSNTVTYTRVTYSTDTPGGNQAAKAPELTDKAESEVMTDLVEVAVPTWAHYVNVARQLLKDVPALRATIDSLLTRGLLDKVDAGILFDLTTVGNFTLFTPTGGDTIGDAVARIVSQLAQAGATDIVVVLNPANFLAMQLTKAEDSGTYLGLPPNVAARITQSASVTAGKILAFAPTTGAAYADREGVSVEAGYTGDGFTKNRATLLCEARGMVVVRDPKHVMWGNLPA